MSRKMNVLNVAEDFASRESGGEVGGFRIFRIEGPVKFRQNEDFSAAAHLLVNDVHVEILKLSRRAFLNCENANLYEEQPTPPQTLTLRT